MCIIHLRFIYVCVSMFDINIIIHVYNIANAIGDEEYGKSEKVMHVYCGSERFDYKNHLCCKGVRHVKREYMKCCGKSVYFTQLRQICKLGYLYIDPNRK